MGRKGRDTVSPRRKTTPQQQQSTIGKDYKGTNLFPAETGIWAPHRAAPTRPATQTPGSENQWRIHPGKSQNCRERGTNCKGGPTQTHLITKTSTETPDWKARGSQVKETHLLILKHLPERQEPVGTPPGDWDTGGSHCEILPLTCWHQQAWPAESPANPVPLPGLTASGARALPTSALQQ